MCKCVHVYVHSMFTQADDTLYVCMHISYMYMYL